MADLAALPLANTREAALAGKLRAASRGATRTSRNRERMCANTANVGLTLRSGGNEGNEEKKEEERREMNGREWNVRNAHWPGRQGGRKTGGGRGSLLERRKKPRYFRPPGAATLIR